MDGTGFLIAMTFSFVGLFLPLLRLRSASGGLPWIFLSKGGSTAGEEEDVRGWCIGHVRSHVNNRSVSRVRAASRKKPKKGAGSEREGHQGVLSAGEAPEKEKEEEEEEGDGKRCGEEPSTTIAQSLFLASCGRSSFGSPVLSHRPFGTIAWRGEEEEEDAGGGTALHGRGKEGELSRCPQGRRFLDGRRGGGGGGGGPSEGKVTYAKYDTWSMPSCTARWSCAWCWGESKETQGEKEEEGEGGGGTRGGPSFFQAGWGFFPPLSRASRGGASVSPCHHKGQQAEEASKSSMLHPSNISSKKVVNWWRSAIAGTPPHAA